MPTPPSPHTHPREFLRALFDAAVAQAQPAQRIAAFLPPPPKGRTVVIGMGKAAGSMAQAVEALWPHAHPMSGLVVTRRGHTPPGPRGRIDIIEAAHPVPDEAGTRAAQRIVECVQGLTPQDLVLCLISGGGSALLSLPLPGISLQDKQALTQALLHSGAAIDEINCVRKHLSAVKGGRLGALCAPARVVSLLISDVPGDAPEVIASGPTVPDPTTCRDALNVLHRHRIPVPAAVQAGLQSGAFETPKPGDARFATHTTHLIATPQQSLQAAGAWARQAGVAAHVLSDSIEGESRDIGRMHAALARQVARHGEPFQPPCVLLSGGETTVTVQNPLGQGGRATEFLLGCALGLQGQAGVHVLAADTDGIDGSQDNAGALIGPDTLARAQALQLSARHALAHNESHAFFKTLGDLVVTGPTFTNVNDFRAVWVAG